MTIAYDISSRAAADSDAVFLGPATVVDMEGAAPIVSVHGARVRAEMALAYPYQPVVGDQLLVIGSEGKHYVIGLLRATGEVALRFVGDVRLHAVAGKLELQGDQGVTVSGDHIDLVGKKVQVLAGEVWQRANHFYQRVRDTLDVHAGQKRELIDGDLSVQADRSTTVTRGVTTINGKEIHLG
jgi:hypothetical protein